MNTARNTALNTALNAALDTTIDTTLNTILDTVLQTAPQTELPPVPGGPAGNVLGVVEPVRLAEMLSEARTPAEVLGALADEGEAFGFDLWAMALLRGDEPEVHLCSVAPLAPAAAASQLAHFADCASRRQGDGDRYMPDWSAARQRLTCLQPARAPLAQEVAHYHDEHVATGESAGAIIRAASLRRPDAGRPAPDWARVPMMVQYAAPYLRAMTLPDAGTTHGMVDAESGMYSWPYFIDAIEREVERSLRVQTEFSLGVVEIKPLRLLGEIPAELHRRVGEHIVSKVRRSDLVGRTGRQSYAVFFYGTGPRPALIAADRIATALAEDDMIRGILSFSLGVSGWDGNGPLEMTRLLSEAGEAAAEAGRVSPGSAFVYI